MSRTSARVFNMQMRRLALAAGLLASSLTLPFVRAEPAARPPAQAADNYSAERAHLLDHISSDALSGEEAQAWLQFAEDIKKHAKEEMPLTARLTRALANPWVLFGFAAQSTFMMRFVVQIIASEKKKKSHVPVAFWYLSLAGGLMLFVYAVRLRDPVFMLGQGLGLIIYARNLVLISRRSSRLRVLLAERNSRAALDGGNPGGIATP